MFRDLQLHAILTTLLGSFISSATWAASFDCTKARNTAEKLICAEPDLSELDQRLADAYDKRIKTREAGGFRKTQRAWLKVRDKCTDASCIRDAYHTRLAELTGSTATSKPCFKLLDRKWPEVQSGRYPVCLDYLKNLNSFCSEPPPTCERRINPAIRKLALPHWEELDPAPHREVIAQLLTSNYRQTKLAQPIPDKVNSCIRERKARLWHAWVDLDHDGKKEHILRFQTGPCQPTHPSGRRIFNEFNYRLAVVDEHAQQVDIRYSYVQYTKDIILHDGRAYLLDSFASDDTLSLMEPFHTSTDERFMNQVCQFQYQ